MKPESNGNLPLHVWNWRVRVPKALKKRSMLYNLVPPLRILVTSFSGFQLLFQPFIRFTN